MLNEKLNMEMFKMLQKICEMQKRNCGRSIDTTTELIDLCAEARLLLERVKFRKEHEW